jgi:PemK-like, MazF-like toxin of type II toxin-antitoxin system
VSQLPNFLQVRAVVLVNFPAQIPPGREQENTRPAVVVASPNVTGITRFSLVIVVPLTTQQGDWATRNSTLCLAIYHQYQTIGIEPYIPGKWPIFNIIPLFFKDFCLHVVILFTRRYPIEFEKQRHPVWRFAGCS